MVILIPNPKPPDHVLPYLVRSGRAPAPQMANIASPQPAETSTTIRTPASKQQVRASQQTRKNVLKHDEDNRKLGDEVHALLSHWHINCESDGPAEWAAT